MPGSPRQPLTCSQRPRQEDEQQTEPPGLRPGKPHPEWETWGGRGRVTPPDPRPPPSHPPSLPQLWLARPGSARLGSARPGHPARLRLQVEELDPEGEDDNKALLLDELSPTNLIRAG